MEENEPSSSNLIQKVRNLSVSRRGGVRTRGGRLPPINARDLPHIPSTKKTIAPKIPQRRAAVKKEPVESTPLIKKEPLEVQSDRGRGRGRGRPQKVFLQLEGFLADGPALKVKKEREDTSYSLGSRTTRKLEKEEPNVDPERIKELLSYYDANEAYDDNFATQPPNRLPLLKDKLTPKIKSEPLDPDDIKCPIKKEKDLFDEESCKKLESKVENDIKSFVDAKDEGMFMLLQWPSCLPLAKEVVENGENTKEPKEPLSKLDNLPEGRVGKFQILKSGKKRLVLGSMTFEIFEGTESETCKEIASVNVEKDVGDIIFMGQIDRTLILRPIIKNLSITD